MRSPGRQYWVLGVVAASLGLGIALRNLEQKSTHVAPLSAPQYLVEVRTLGPQNCFHTVVLNTTSQAVREECQIFPGLDMVQTLMKQGMPVIRQPFVADSPHPAVQMLGKITVIEATQIVVDGQTVPLASQAKRIEFRERDGSVEILADNLGIHRFKR
ncbi:MAG TPA: hypothetical protein VGG64_04240 [Pirellulales bacterium]|jgi:hypothetical protein